MLRSLPVRLTRRCSAWWARRMRAAATPVDDPGADGHELAGRRARSCWPPYACRRWSLHRIGDALFAVEEARYIAEHIPGAQLVELLDGDDHFVSGDPDQILDAIEPFVSGTPRPEHHLALAAVVACPARARRGRPRELGRLRRPAAATPRRATWWSCSTDPRPAYGRCAARSPGHPRARRGLSIAEVAVEAVRSRARASTTRCGSATDAVTGSCW